MAKIADYFGMVKFAHTIFALPFALIGFALGVTQVGFGWVNAVATLLCMVFARNSAMGFNRLIDRKFDAKNERTAKREIPGGIISPKAARCFVALNCVLFVCSASLFRIGDIWNPWPLILSPVALGVILGYSYTKRFTALCHLVLGLGLAIAPSGAYLAITGGLTPLPILFSCLVLSWVSGFDVIYALQDADFDADEKLHSIPESFGVRKALIISLILHAISTVFVIVIAVLLNSVWCWIGSGVFLLLLGYQHAIVKAEDLSKIGVAFGTTNGVASVVYASFVIMAIAMS